MPASGTNMHTLTHTYTYKHTYTHAHTHIHTHTHRAPEKHTAQPGDKHKFGFPTDIWALGATLAQIVAADVVAPWERGQSISGIIIQVCNA